MVTENGEWYIKGLDWNDPLRIRTADELINYVNEVGFLPLFANEIEGFSAEEHTAPDYWWSGVESEDPWEWREQIARSKKVVYGKFFHKKAGFISLDWFPVFANYRRDGYDFDAKADEGLANIRERKIMKLFMEDEEYLDRELYSYEIRREAGFGKGGEKNFQGIMTDLQMQTYIVLTDFRQKINKSGNGYGWFVAIHTTPEAAFGKEFVDRAYDENPAVSRQKIYDRVRELFPEADEKALDKVLK